MRKLAQTILLILTGPRVEEVMMIVGITYEKCQQAMIEVFKNKNAHT